MADLHLLYPRLNPYFRDARIRRCLLNAGLINRHGDILRNTTGEEAVARSPPRRRRMKQSNKSDSLRRSNSRSLSNIHRQPQSSDEKRPKSAYPSTSTRRPTTGKRRSPPAPSPPPKQLCRLTMRYLKPQTKIDYDISWLPQKGDEIIIMQQHCGGENLTAFKGFVEPGGKFSFDSQRHVDYPFALAFYINGLIDSRISVCCEYRHKKNTPLGGPSGLFAIVNVERATPCHSCRLRRLKKKGQLTLSLGLEQARYRRSVVPNIQNNRRSPSLPRPQSPIPPLQLNEKKTKKRRSSKKRVIKIPTPSSSSSRRSIEPTEANEKKSTDTSDSEEKQPPVTKPDRSLSKENSDRSRLSTRVPRQKSPAISDDQKPTTVTRKIDDHSSNESSDEREISLNQQHLKPPSNDQKPTTVTRKIDHHSSNESSDERKISLNQQHLKPSSNDQKPTTVTRKIDHHSSNESSDEREISLNQQHLKPPSNDQNKTELSVGINRTNSISKKNGNYSTDFDEATDDEQLPPTHTRLKQQHTSDSHSIGSKKKTDSFENLDDSDYPSKSTLKKTISSDSSNHPSNQESSELFNETKPTLDQSQYSLPSNDENKQQILTDNSHENRSKIRRSSSNSSEDFLGIKPASPRESKKTTQNLEDDFFESENRNDQVNSNTKTKSWRDDNFFD